MSWIDTAQSFQTSIVGVIGFAGIIVSQNLNAYFVRKQAESSLSARRRIVVAGIKAELKVFEKALKEIARRPEIIRGEQFLIPRMKRTVSPNLIGEIGLLHRYFIDPVLKAVLTVDEMDRALVLFSSEVTDEYFVVEGEKYGDVSNVAHATLPTIGNAIALLETVE